MGVRLRCPDCGFSLDGSTSGDRPPCAGCRQRALLAINARRRDDDEEDDDDRARKKKRPVAEDDEVDDDRPRKKKPIAEDDDEDDDRPRKKKRPVAEDDEDDDRPRRKKRPRDEDDDEEEEEVKPRKKAKNSTRDKDEEEEDEEDERKPIKPGSRRDKMTKAKGAVISFSVAIYCLLALFVLGGLARSFGLWFISIAVVIGYFFQFFFYPLIIGVPIAFIVGNVFALWLPPRAEGRAFAIAGIALMSLGLVMHFFGYAFIFSWIMQGDALRAGRLGFLFHVGSGFAFLMGFYASMLFLKQLSLFLGNRPLSNVPLTWAGFFTIVLVLNYLLIQFIGDMLAFGLWMIHVINGVATALSLASLYIFIMMSKMLDEFRVMVQQDIDKK